jgi:Rab GDP dissociation inhibitor
VSTIAETNTNHHLELKPGFERLGEIEEKFMGPPIPLYAPIDSGVKDNIFISKSYDATSHFETTTGMIIPNCGFHPVHKLMIYRRCA